MKAPAGDCPVDHDAAGVPSTPPPPPDPNVDDAAAATVIPPNANTPGPEKSDEPRELADDQWDICAVSGLGVLRMLITAVESLAEKTGDIPPTPPVSRPTTPRKPNQSFFPPDATTTPTDRASKRLSSTPIRAAGPDDSIPHPAIGSPEAAPTEPITIDATAPPEDHRAQHAAIARRFFSKTAPPFSLASYLLQLHRHCPHSPGVYLTATAYLYRLCIVEQAVPATRRTVHRLCLAAIRVAAKAVEDNKWAQARVAKVGGVGLPQLMNLEITLCFLLDFDLGVDARQMARGLWGLQQAACRGCMKPLQLRLPPRIRSAG